MPIDFGSWRNIPRYAIFQLEIGENGTPHLQGYVVYHNPVVASALSKYIGGNPHIEVRRGTHSQAKAYCSKEDTRVEGPWTYGSDEGIPESQGARSDLAAVKRKLDDGVKMSVIAEDHFSDFIRYSKGFREYKRLKTPVRRHQMEVIVLIGGTGTGKTRYVHDNFEDIYSVPQPKSSGCYWDDYDGQETVLIDEMYGSRFSHGFLLQLLDRYDFSVPVHGGSMRFTSKRIVMTSNSHPDLWYSGVYEKQGIRFDEGPLYRRMTQGMSCIIRCDKNPFRMTILNYK